MIRLLEPEDYGLWQAIRLESVRAHPAALDDTEDEVLSQSETEWAEMLKTSCIFVSMSGEQPVGLAGYFFADRAKLRHRAKVFGVYVNPAHRGKGIMDWLLGALEYNARDHGFEQLHLNVGVDNDSAIRCYERNGYAIYGTEPRMLKLDGRYVDEHMMVKYL